MINLSCLCLLIHFLIIDLLIQSLGYLALASVPEVLVGGLGFGGMRGRQTGR